MLYRILLATVSTAAAAAAAAAAAVATAVKVAAAIAAEVAAAVTSAVLARAVAASGQVRSGWAGHFIVGYYRWVGQGRYISWSVAAKVL